MALGLNRVRVVCTGTYHCVLHAVVYACTACCGRCMYGTAAGDGINEPAYCDPTGFALQAARAPGNKAQVADVVTQTRGWMSGMSHHA